MPNRAAHASSWLAAFLFVVACSPTGTPTSTRATISGRVVLQSLAGANDMSRVRVDIGRGEGGVAPDEGGNFVFEDIEADVYTLSVTFVGGLTLNSSGSAYQRFEQRVVARSGGSVSLGDIVLQLATGTVDGEVTVPEGDDGDVEGADVTLELSDGRRLTATVTGGTFSVPDVPVGYHRLTVSKTGLAVPAGGVAAGNEICGAAVTVPEGEAQVHVPRVSLVSTRMRVEPGDAQITEPAVTRPEGTTWYLTGSAISIYVTAPFAAQGRIWLGETDPPSYAPFAGVQNFDNVPTGRTRARIQLRDPCNYETPETPLWLIRDVTPPVIDLALLGGGAPFLRSTTADLLVSASDELSDLLEMREVHCNMVDNEPSCDINDAAWTPYDHQQSLTFDDVNATKVVLLQLRDRAGNETEVVTLTAEYDTQPPANPSVTLAGGLDVIRATTQPVDLSAEGATEMQVGLDSTLGTAAWQPYNPTWSVTFPSGDGPKTVYARFRDAAGNATDIVQDGATLDTTGVVAGVVSLEDGSSPSVAEANVLGSQLTASVGADGFYRITGVPSGNHVVEIRLGSGANNNFRPVQLPVSMTAGATVTLPNVTLQRRRGDLTGPATLEGSADAGGILVELLGTSAAAVTGASGDYALRSIPTGSYQLRLSRAGYDTVTTASVDVLDNTVVSAPTTQLPLLRGDLQGVVVLEDEESPTLAQVVLLGTQYQTTPDDNGNWSLTGIPAGTYTLQARVTGSLDVRYYAELAVVRVDANSVTTVPAVTLLVARGAVRGTYALEGMSDASGILVSVEETGQVALTGANGSFRIEDVPGGTYTLRASRAPDFTSVTEVITVTGDITTVASTQTLEVVDSGVVRGRALLEGAVDHALTSVTLTGVDVRNLPVSLTTTTGTDGSFELSGLVAGNYELSFSHTGFDALASTSARVNTGAITALSPVTLRVSRGTVEGVVTATGTPSAAGTLVTLSGAESSSTFTDDTGAWRLQNVRAATGYVVTAQREGYASTSSAPFNVVANAVTTAPALTIAPSTTAAINGVATLEGATDHSGITITLSGNDLNGAPVNASAVTGVDGSYGFNALKQGTYNLRYDRTGYQLANTLGLPVTAGATVTVPDVALALARGDLTGQVLLQGMTDHSGVQVALAGSLSTFTDSAGNFSLRGVPVSSYTLTASKGADWQSQSTSVTVSRDTATSTGTLTLPVVATSTVTGSATLEGASDHAGTVVTLLGSDFRGVAVSRSTTTGTTGDYSFTGLASGDYQLSFSNTGFLPPSGQAVRVLAAATITALPVQLTVARGHVEGVVTASGATDSSGTIVTVTGPDSASAITDPSGAWRIFNLRAGSGYTVTTLRRGYTGVTSGAFVIDANATVTAPSLTITAATGASIVGVAQAEDGNHAGIQVTLTGTDLNGTSVVDSTVTSATGDYQFNNLREGVYSVEHNRNAHVGTAIRGFTVAANASVTLQTVVLALARGRASGQVVLQGASDHSGALVSVGGQSAVTDGTGAFTLLAIPEGNHTLTVSKAPDWVADTRAITITRDSTTATGTITLAPLSNATVTGVANLEGATDHAGTAVTLSGVDFRGVVITGVTATTATDGSFSFTALRAGDYQLAFSATGYDAVAGVPVHVSSSSTITAPPVGLAISRGEAGGVVNATGAADLSGTVVNVDGPERASTLTDATGAWRIPGLRVGTGYSVTAQRRGYTPVTSAFSVVANTATTVGPITISPSTNASLLGTIAAETGDGSGVTITLSGNDLNGSPVSDSFTTAAGGAFAFSSLKEGTYNLEYTGTGLQGASSRGVFVAADTTLDLGVIPVSRVFGSVSGQYVLQGASSHEGVVVTVAGISTVTDALGNFFLTGVDEGSQTITATKAPDYQSASGPVTVTRNATVTLSAVTLNVIATAALTGTATLEGTTNHAGITVSLVGSDFRGQAVNLSATTTSAGAYTFSSLVAGDYQLSYSSSGYDDVSGVAVHISSGAAATAGAVRLDLSRGDIQGTVSATGAGDPSGTVVTVSGPETFSTVTDATGAWRVSGARTGTGYSATASRAGYTSQSSASFAVTADTTTTVAAITISPSTGASISGTVAVGAGTPNGVTVSLTGTDLNGASVTASTTSNGTGSYSLTGLKQGTYSLTFSKTAYDPQTLAGIAVPVDTAVTASTVTLTVSRGALQGNAVLSAGTVTGLTLGSDHSGIVITLGGTLTPVPSVVTDASGNWRMEGVPVSLSGSAYTVTASKPNFVTQNASVTVVGNTTTTVGNLTLPVDAGSARGTVVLDDNVNNGGPNASSAGATVSLSGTTFNGATFTASAVTAADGTWSTANLPPGRFEVTVSSTDRACEDLAAITVQPGGTGVADPCTCTDTVAPSALAFGSFDTLVNTATVDVPLGTAATDATSPLSNFRDYQLGVGTPPTWFGSDDTPPFTFTLTANGSNVLWVRGRDWSGNTGVASSVTVTHDGIAPDAPSISTPRVYVDATTTSVTLSGSEDDENFDHYEICTAVASNPTDTAPPASCTSRSTTASTFALSLASGEKTWLFAWAVDGAGNENATPSVVGIISDLSAPEAPSIEPVYDSTLLTVRADVVDIFVQSGATDAPLGGTASPYKGVAYLEVDLGSGFAPLCNTTDADCYENGDTWNPCAESCECRNDNRISCAEQYNVVTGTSTFSLRSFRATLTPGTNRVAVRAVDLAGNVGDGAAVNITAEGMSVMSARLGAQNFPRQVGTFLSYLDNQFVRLAQMKPDRRGEAAAYCNIDTGADPRPYGEDTNLYLEAASAIGRDRFFYVEKNGATNRLMMRQPGTDGTYCTGDDTITLVRNPPANFRVASVATIGDSNVVFMERDVSTGATADTKRVFYVNGGTTTPQPDAVGLGHRARLTSGGRYALWVTGSSDDPVGCPAASGPLGPGEEGCMKWLLRYYAPAGGTSDYTFNAWYAAISRDGTMLFTASNQNEAGPGATCTIRSAGADPIYGNANDEVASINRPDDRVVSGISIDGVHAVAVIQDGNGVSSLLDWDAAGDAVFKGAGDDTYDVTTVGSVTLTDPQLHNGVVISTYGDPHVGDLVAHNLSNMHWEAVYLSNPVLNGRGVMVAWDNDKVVARQPDGKETRWPVATTGSPTRGSVLVNVQPGNAPFAATDGDLLVANTAGVAVYNAGPNQYWFDNDDPDPVQVFTLPANEELMRVTANEGRGLIVTRNTTTGNCRLTVLEPGSPSNSLLTPTTVSNIQGAFNKCDSFGSASISRYHAVWDYRPDAVNQNVAIYSSTDGVFGNGNDTAALLLNNGGGVPYDRALHANVGGTRVVFYDGTASANVIVNSFNNVFNDIDDTRDTVMPVGELVVYEHRLAGDKMIYVAEPSAGGGLQVLSHDILTGISTQLTHHFSEKGTVLVDPSGRAIWDDSFLINSVFVYKP
ncbi:MAG: carboxypeptidase regulatory-like domain-containing protein [Myxococcota bacterium]